MSAVIPAESKALEVQSDNGYGRTLMGLIERVALDPNYPIERLQQLLELKKQWEADEARKAFDAAISAAKSEIKPVVKNREVDFTTDRGRTNYHYEDLAQIAEHIDPILAKYGLSYRHRSQQSGNALTITCRVSHKAGYFEEVSLTAANDQSGSKNTIQSIGSTATYLQRYTLKIALGIAAARDDDGRGGAPNGSPPNGAHKETPAKAVEVPPGFADWKDSMVEVAKKGTAALQAAWKAADGGYRGYATTADEQWWQQTKAAARKVDAAPKQTDASVVR